VKLGSSLSVASFDDERDVAMAARFEVHFELSVVIGLAVPE